VFAKHFSYLKEYLPLNFFANIPGCEDIFAKDTSGVVENSSAPLGMLPLKQSSIIFPKAKAHGNFTSKRSLLLSLKPQIPSIQCGEVHYNSISLDSL